MRVHLDLHLRDLMRRVEEIGHKGENEPEICEVTEDEPAVSGDERGEPTQRFGIFSGFAGFDAPSAAAADLGGVPIAAFDNNEVVRGLWEAGHEGRP